MHLKNILSPARTEVAVNIPSKKRLLEYLSNLVSSELTNINSHEVYEALIARERLGSTAIGKGVAIPHSRIQSTEHTIGAFVRLSKAIDFDAPDHEKVDLFFLLLVPEAQEHEHLEVLSLLASLFKNPDFRQRIRDCANSDELYQYLTLEEHEQSQSG